MLTKIQWYLKNPLALVVGFLILQSHKVQKCKQLYARTITMRHEVFRNASVCPEESQIVHTNGSDVNLRFNAVSPQLNVRLTRVC